MLVNVTGGTAYVRVNGEVVKVPRTADYAWVRLTCDGVPVIEDLPDPKDGVTLLASKAVASLAAASGRTDVAYVDLLAFDGEAFAVGRVGAPAAS